MTPVIQKLSSIESINTSAINEFKFIVEKYLTNTNNSIPKTNNSIADASDKSHSSADIQSMSADNFKPVQPVFPSISNNLLDADIKKFKEQFVKLQQNSKQTITQSQFYTQQLAFDNQLLSIFSKKHKDKKQHTKQKKIQLQQDLLSNIGDLIQQKQSQRIQQPIQPKQNAQQSNGSTQQHAQQQTTNENDQSITAQKTGKVPDTKQISMNTDSSTLTGVPKSASQMYRNKANKLAMAVQNQRDDKGRVGDKNKSAAKTQARGNITPVAAAAKTIAKAGINTASIQSGQSITAQDRDPIRNAFFRDITQIQRSTLVQIKAMHNIVKSYIKQLERERRIKSMYADNDADANKLSSLLSKFDKTNKPTLDLTPGQDGGSEGSLFGDLLDMGLDMFDRNKKAKRKKNAKKKKARQRKGRKAARRSRTKGLRRGKAGKLGKVAKSIRKRCC